MDIATTQTHPFRTHDVEGDLNAVYGTREIALTGQVGVAYQATYLWYYVKER